MRSSVCLLEGWTRRHDGSEAEFPVVSIVDGMSFVLVRFQLVHKYLEKLRSNQGAVTPGVAKLDEGWTTGCLELCCYVILPDEGDEIVRIQARMIEQDAGEDPATGSAASALASYHSLTELERRESKCIYEIAQGVEIGRASKLFVKVVLAGDENSVKQVLLTGSSYHRHARQSSHLALIINKDVETVKHTKVTKKVLSEAVWTRFTALNRMLSRR